MSGVPETCDQRNAPARQAVTEDKGISATLAAVPTACYAGRKPELRVLCGSV